MGFRAIVPSLGKWGRGGSFPLRPFSTLIPCRTDPGYPDNSQWEGIRHCSFLPPISIPEINVWSWVGLGLYNIWQFHSCFIKGADSTLNQVHSRNRFKFSWFLEVFEQSIILSMLNKSHEINSQFSNQFLNLWVPTLARCRCSFPSLFILFLLINNKCANFRFNFLSLSIFIYIS